MAKLHRAGTFNGHVVFMFHCPACECAHSVNDTWKFISDDLDNPTIRESVLSNGDLSCPSAPRCHSFVTDGKIHYLEDCTHKMAGQTVDLPDFDL